MQCIEHRDVGLRFTVYYMTCLCARAARRAPCCTQVAVWQLITIAAESIIIAVVVICGSTVTSLIPSLVSSCSWKLGVHAGGRHAGWEEGKAGAHRTELATRPVPVPAKSMAKACCISASQGTQPVKSAAPPACLHCVRCLVWAGFAGDPHHRGRRAGGAAPGDGGGTGEAPPL